MWPSAAGPRCLPSLPPSRRGPPTPRELDMSWKPIIVGVDGSPESVRAAVLGVAAAARAGTTCHLVHAGRRVPHSERYPYPLLDEEARAPVVSALANRVPAAVLDALTMREGMPGAVLNAMSGPLCAELVLLA